MGIILYYYYFRTSFTVQVQPLLSLLETRRKKGLHLQCNLLLSEICNTIWHLSTVEVPRRAVQEVLPTHAIYSLSKCAAFSSQKLPQQKCLEFNSGKQ